MNDPWAPHTWPMPPPRLAPGVRGIVREEPHQVVVGFLLATNPGNGDVGRYLDQLQRRAKAVVVVECMSERLQGMLQRRGFRTMRSPRYGDAVQVLRWQPTGATAAHDEARPPMRD